MADQVVQTPGGGLGGRQPRRRKRLNPRARASLAQRAARRATGGRVAANIAGLLPGPTTALGTAPGAATGAAGVTTGGVSALRRFAPLAALIGPFVGIQAFNRITQLRERGKQTREALELLQNPAERENIIQQQLLRERLQENIISAKLARMQNVARNDPNLFKMLSAMVAGSKRPRTTASTIRIGPEPSQLDMLQSGLF